MKFDTEGARMQYLGNFDCDPFGTTSKTFTTKFARRAPVQA